MKTKHVEDKAECRFCGRVSRAREAQRLRKQGLSLRQIAEAIGVDKRTVCAYMTQAV